MNTERDTERFENLYKLQETIGKCNYATWYFHEHFTNEKADKISEKIHDLCERIHDLINDICIYDERK